MGKRSRYRAADAVERYLRHLTWWSPRHDRDELVAEARRHLYDATCRVEQQGICHRDAQRAAIKAFGPAWRIGLAAHRGSLHPSITVASGLIALGNRLTRLRPRKLRRHRQSWPPDL